MTAPLHIVWFRRDLRLTDNPALTAAAKGGAVLPVFVLPTETDDWAAGAAACGWRVRSLGVLRQTLRDRGGDLVIRSGNAAEVLAQLAAETGAVAVHWNRCYEPAAIARQEDVRKQLDIKVHAENGSLLAEPWELATQDGKPYKVFTPFWKRFCKEVEVPKPLPVPSEITWPESWPDSADISGGEAAAGLDGPWTPGENAAQKRLRAFVDDTLADYPDGRDRPDCDGTSRLSPYLHHGELSVRQVWHGVGRCNTTVAVQCFRRELAWREFAYSLLYHFPETPTTPLHERYTAFPWREDDDALAAWQNGRTGFPIVDAGMRQLRETGWMHNRVRMVVASFLVKDLLLPWQAGARWFWERLVDADLANNTLGWQWAAGCGADAAPYFRIFNPTSQAEKHDPDGAYIRRWVPELADTNDVHAPRPDAIVDHGEARERALAAYERVKSS